MGVPVRLTGNCGKCVSHEGTVSSQRWLGPDEVPLSAGDSSPLTCLWTTEGSASSSVSLPHAGLGECRELGSADSCGGGCVRLPGAGPTSPAQPRTGSSGSQLKAAAEPQRAQVSTVHEAVTKGIPSPQLICPAAIAHTPMPCLPFFWDCLCHFQAPTLESGDECDARTPVRPMIPPA